MSPKLLSWIFHILLVVTLVVFIIYAFLLKDEKVNKEVKTALIIGTGVLLILTLVFVVWYFLSKNKVNKVNQFITGINPNYYPY
jgi:hypothetical protein